MTEPDRHGTLARFMRRASHALDVVAGLIFLTIFLTIVAQTTMRYVFASPLTTSQELATIAFVWLIFWTAACCLRIEDHVRFDIVYVMVSDRWKRIFSIVCTLVFLVVFVVAARATVDYFVFLRMQYTASLAITYQIAFFPYFIFFFVFPLRLALNLLRLLGPNWKEAI